MLVQFRLTAHRTRVARHVPRCLSELELCTCRSLFDARPSDKLNIPQPGGQVTIGSLSIEQAEEIFT